MNRPGLGNILAKRTCTLRASCAILKALTRGVSMLFVKPEKKRFPAGPTALLRLSTKDCNGRPGILFLGGVTWQS